MVILMSDKIKFRITEDEIPLYFIYILLLNSEVRYNRVLAD